MLIDISVIVSIIIKVHGKGTAVAENTLGLASAQHECSYLSRDPNQHLYTD